MPKWKTTSKNIPKFILEPQNAYIIRGQPATLKCKVIHADKAYFTCNGEAMAASEMHKEVDSIEINEAEGIEAVTVKTLSLQLDRINIEEFFGLYSCRCDAWSAKGMTSSKNASIEVACKYFYLILFFKNILFSMMMHCKELRCVHLKKSLVLGFFRK